MPIITIYQAPKARSRRLMAMFGADWRDPTRYDLTSIWPR